jgi:hypothetical protein
MARPRRAVRRRTETGSDVVARRVIVHTPSGRTVLITLDTTRLSDATTRARTAANDRRSVRSPELSRDCAAETTSALARPKTASTEPTRDTIRSGRESPRAAGCEKTRVAITAE